MKKYEMLERIGAGAYGKVFKAKDKTTGAIVALKILPLLIDNKGIPATTLREISLLKMLSKSRYIVRLIDVWYVDDTTGNSSSLMEIDSDDARRSCSKKIPAKWNSSLHLVLEYMDMDLDNFIAVAVSDIEPNLIKRFLFQLCKGVAHCHSHGVLHRDLKPQNLLLDKDKKVLKIADLGLSRSFTVPPKSYTHDVVTLRYRAPEILLGSTHYSTAVDMWSVGCIFGEMVKRKVMFPGFLEFEQLMSIFSVLGTPTEKEWPGVTSLKDWHIYPQWKVRNLALEFPPLDSKGVKLPSLDSNGVDLLSKMLKYDPSARISAEAALVHPYFDSLDKSQF